jgi:predicted O-methyltransferase YrrM
LVRHLRPETVIETGVARGFTSRFILEALERNGSGHLWSVDLPPMRAPKLHPHIGAAVRPELHHRWSYVKGTSRQHLPNLLAQLKQVDLFVHDSRHTERNVLFELTQAWSALRVGGAVVADDIHENWGFDSFSRRVSPSFVLNCYAEPLRPGPPPVAARGLFGIALNFENRASLKL